MFSVFNINDEMYDILKSNDHNSRFEDHSCIHHRVMKSKHMVKRSKADGSLILALWKLSTFAVLFCGATCTKQSL